MKDLKTYVHGIFYITTFTILQNNVVDFCYSMLLGRPWLRDVKVAHDWGSKIVTIQGNGMVQTITVTKHLGSEVRRLEVLLCYNTSRNQSKCNQSIYDYMRLIVVCD